MAVVDDLLSIMCLVVDVLRCGQHVLVDAVRGGLTTAGSAGQSDGPRFDDCCFDSHV